MYMYVNYRVPSITIPLQAIHTSSVTLYRTEGKEGGEEGGEGEGRGGGREGEGGGEGRGGKGRGDERR